MSQRTILITGCSSGIGYACALGWSMAYVGAVAMFGERRETLRHEALAQTIGDLVLRQDRDGSVVYASNEAFSMFGLSPRELMGRGLFERVHVGDRPAFLSAIADALAGSTTVTCQVRLRRGAANDQDAPFVEPSFAWIEMRTHNLPEERRASDPKDRAAVVTIVRDVTRARQAEEDINNARENAEQANIWKDRFLANVSHELRTPLSALLGFIETLRGPARDDIPARERFLAIMNEQASRMTRLVNDLLSLSKIEESEHNPPVQSVALAPILGSVADALNFQARAKGMTIALDVAPDLPSIVGDADQLVQVFQNLIDNAIKYGRAQTTVRVSVKKSQGAAGNIASGQVIAVAIADEGDGIPREHLPRLTERFYRVDAGRSRQLGGTGLGLAIVKHIVNRHRGALTIESEQGRGTTVTVYLPIAAKS